MRRWDAGHCQRQILIEGRFTAVWPSRLEACFTLKKFRICGIDPQGDFLGTEEGMFRAQKHVAWDVFRSDPDGSRSTNKAERILSDNFCRTFDFKGDAAGCIRAHRAVLIRHAEHDARCVGAVGHELAFVGAKLKLLINALSGKRFCDCQPAGKKPLDSKISRQVAGSRQVQNKRRVRKIPEFEGFPDLTFRERIGACDNPRL